MFSDCFLKAINTRKNNKQTAQAKVGEYPSLWSWYACFAQTWRASPSPKRFPKGCQAWEALGTGFVFWQRCLKKVWQTVCGVLQNKGDSKQHQWHVCPTPACTSGQEWWQLQKRRWAWGPSLSIATLLVRLWLRLLKHTWRPIAQILKGSGQGWVRSKLLLHS